MPRQACPRGLQFASHESRTAHASRTGPSPPATSSTPRPPAALRHLSKQIATLEQAGYVTVRKTGAGRNRRTHLRLSPRGRQAFRAHAAALQQIIASAGALAP
jgi:hypothetical protein